MLPDRLEDSGVTVWPCIESTAGVVAYPEPTTVTVVPTEPDDGLTTVIDVESTVYEAALNPAAAIERNPLLACMLNAK